MFNIRRSFNYISFKRIRAFLLRLALGKRTFDYMIRSTQADKRTPGAKLVDIVIRQDGREERIEADWVKTIAKITKHVKSSSVLQRCHESIRLS